MDLVLSDRELDVLVAENVMGCTLEPYHDLALGGAISYTCGCRPRRHSPDPLLLYSYSTDIAAVAQVIERIKEMPAPIPDRFVFEIELAAYDGDLAVTLIRGERGHYPDKLLEMILPKPRTICLATLQEVGVEVPA